jgi:hypothetical protein
MTSYKHIYIYIHDVEAWPMINKTRINKPGEEQKIHKLKSKILVTEKNLNTKRGCLSPIWQCLPRPKRNPWLSQSGCNHMRSHEFFLS